MKRAIMSSLSRDTVYWRSAASNARAIAETFDDEAARLAMRKIAAKLEAMARRAYARENGLELAHDREAR